MNQNQMREIMIKTVMLTCDELSDIELAVLNNTAQMDMDPHGRLFDYEKVKGLFTERSGTRMHEETKVALASVVNIRLGEK
jgi:hypothetical protein